MTIKEEFETIIKAKYPRQLMLGKLKSPYAFQHDAFLEGAKWMAERCANELYGQKIADGSDPGETIRQLSKELE